MNLKFLAPSLNHVYQKLCYNEPYYKEIPAYIVVPFYTHSHVQHHYVKPVYRRKLVAIQGTS